jgi:hypothetical protein
MLAPALIDRDFVPYTRRPIFRRNAALFVDGSAGKGGGGSRVVPQCLTSCEPRNQGMPCGVGCQGKCNGYECVY